MPLIILKLANELISTILEHIDDHATLRAVAQTCSHLQCLAEPILYRGIFQRVGTEAVALSKSVTNRTERADAIHAIESRCKWQHLDGLNSLALVIPKAKNLTKLTIESPYCNRSYGDSSGTWESIMDQLLRPVYSIEVVNGAASNPLPRLTQLTLHLSKENERYWDITSDLSAIFAHPSIQSLTISCANVYGKCIEQILVKPRTPLKTLVFIECNINLRALNAILYLPRALERLHIGQNIEHAHSVPKRLRGEQQYGVGRLFKQDPMTFFDCLSRHEHSLESLTYVKYRAQSTEGHLPADWKGFAGFSKLRHVTLDGHCSYFMKALSMEHTAPPKLMSLEVKDHWSPRPTPGLDPIEDYRVQVGWALASASIIASLHEVRIASTQAFTDISKDHRDAIVKLGDLFENTGTKMKVFTRRRQGAIPPFLYGEKPDNMEPVYVSGGDGFVGPFRLP